MHFRIQVSIELKSPLSANFQFSNFQNKLKRACGKNGELVLHCFQWEKSGLKLIFLRSSGHFFEKRRFFRTTSGKNEAICKFSLGSEDYFGANKFAQNWGAEKESRLVAPLAALAADYEMILRITRDQLLITAIVKSIHKFYKKFNLM